MHPLDCSLEGVHDEVARLVLRLHHSLGLGPQLKIA